MGRGSRTLRRLWAGMAALAVCAAALPAFWRATAARREWWLLGAALLSDPAAALALYGRESPAVPVQAGTAAAPTPVPSPSAAPTAQPAVPQPAPNGLASAFGPSPAPHTSPAATPTPAPVIPADAGPVTALHYSGGSGSVRLAAGSINNRTANPDSVLAAAAQAPALPFTVVKNSREPQVLILHTHATECYQPWDEPLYDPDFAARTTDRTQNMCVVGERMAQVLTAAGINTLHDTTLHDSPSYTEAYARSAATARRYLEKYPSIKVILDVHRDAIESDGARIKPLTQIGGQDTAQVMLIAGCDNGGSVRLPDWEKNLRFAAAWEESMETLYPGLTRPVLCGYRFYNQDITTGSLLIEVGGHANTLDEALRAGELAAQALARVLGG